MDDLFWNVLGTERTIAGAINNVSLSIDAAAASRPPDLDKANSDDSGERLDQLLLVCAAMWELVKEKTSLTDEELITRVAMLDAKDGVADGKFTQTPVKCPQCNRILSPKHTRCLYCGAAVPVDSVFKTI